MHMCFMIYLIKLHYITLHYHYHYNYNYNYFPLPLGLTTLIPVVLSLSKPPSTQARLRLTHCSRCATSSSIALHAFRLICLASFSLIMMSLNFSISRSPHSSYLSIVREANSVFERPLRFVLVSKTAWRREGKGRLADGRRLIRVFSAKKEGGLWSKGSEARSE